MFVSAFKHAIRKIETTAVMPKSKIINLINANTTIQGLHEKVLRNSILKLSAADSPLKNKWELSTESITLNTNINQILSSIKDSKVCVIDSSIYGNRQTDANPYTFFCLGLSHAFQREVIPITNTPSLSNTLPFDVRGLWHIFFDNLEQLQKQFMAIMPEIDKNWYSEQEDYLYRNFWDPFLKNKRLYIMTCARGTKEEHRGPRTNIDKWDYTTVSELSHFLALKYPKCQIDITPTRSKLTKQDINNAGRDEVSADIKRLIHDKDCIIIGSPDVSDIAEVVSAKLHGIEPYEEKRTKFNGYVFIKTLQPNTMSTFYWQKNENEQEGICQFDPNTESYNLSENKMEKDKSIIYGVLTIANNPFVSPGQNRKIMILSGSSGIATYAMAKLLTDETYKKHLKRLNDSGIDYSVSVEILIGTKFSINAGLEKGDNRIFKDLPENIFVKDVLIIS